MLKSPFPCASVSLGVFLSIHSGCLQNPCGEFVNQKRTEKGKFG